MAISVRTLSVARHRHNLVVGSGRNGAARRFTWMQYRTEAILLGAQVLSLIWSVYRVFHPDLWGSSIRTGMTILIAVALNLSLRDCRWMEGREDGPV